MIRTTAALSHQSNAELLFALNKTDLVKNRSLLEERKQMIVKEIPPSLVSPVYIDIDILICLKVGLYLDNDRKEW